MDCEQIKAVLERVVPMGDNEVMSSADCAVLSDALVAAPYFSVAALMLLRHGGDYVDAARRESIRQHLALTVSSRRTLAYSEYGDEWAHFYPMKQEPSAPATEDVISTFLQTYGNCSPEEEKQLERMIFNPTPDYAELLARQEQSELPEKNEAPAGSQEARINAFILSQHPAMHHEPELLPEEVVDDTPATKPEHSDDSLLSESLAKIFIRQHRYERAYEIISGLSLKFPKKSAYFADQLRFLQKLIINQRRQSQLGEADASKK